jgi:hypothetical protein
MNKYVLIASPMSLFLSSAAIAQHGGTEQEQRACAGNVRRCRTIAAHRGCIVKATGVGRS